jgi:putative nucleotidyltransferase with HDIG domain
VIQNLGAVLTVLSDNPDPELRANYNLGFISVMLGRYRGKIQDHLKISLNPDRSHRSLLIFAALYHDIAKPQTRTQDQKGNYHFYNHEHSGSVVIRQRSSELRLSNDEVEFLGRIVRNHLRPVLLANEAENPSHRSIYRFFRDTGATGVDICLLNLADMLGVYGYTMPGDKWTKILETVRLLFEAWWERPEKSVSPPILINGTDLMLELELAPGPQIGQLLEAVREAQVEGIIHDRSEAIEFARKIELRIQG